MKRPYYLFSNGRLRRRQNTLFLERADAARVPDDDPEDTGSPSGNPTGDKVPFPIEQVDHIYAFGEIDINTKLVTFLAQQGVPLHFFDYYGNYTATLCPRAYLQSGRLKVAQVRHYLNRRKRLVLARAFVDAASYNILRVVKYYITRARGETADELQALASGIDAERAGMAAAGCVAELMGIEGRIRKAYYESWPAILGEAGADFHLEKRERRPPSNELNALISFGNAMCYTIVLKQIYRTALDPTISYLHEPGDRRFSLALDLSEVFKPLLVDRAIFRLIKTRALMPSDFEERIGGVYLREAGRRTFVQHWDERLKSTIRHRSLDRNVSYERLVRLECYRLIRHLFDPAGDPYTGFRMWW
ncbi:MAG: type I-B CRISPR-associated endonuclease Cas1b [Longimicrobiales bacterium]